MSTTQNTQWLETLSKILLRCWIFGFMILLFWFGAVTVCGDLAYSVHGSIFGLGLHELRLIHYCGILLTKLVVSLLFFIPWLSIRLVLKKSKA